MKRDFTKTSPSRLVQIRRFFQVAAILATARTHYMTVDNVAVKLREQTGKAWCDRTVRRDLNALVTVGVINQADDGRFVWSASETTSRVVLRSMESVEGVIPPKPKSRLESFLNGLPAPWEMDAEQQRLATSSARLVALFDTSDRDVMNAQLVYVLDGGWTLQNVKGPVSIFDQHKPLSKLAESEVREIDIDHDRWKLTETGIPASKDRRPGQLACV
jgi:hypothetical protein